MTLQAGLWSIGALVLFAAAVYAAAVSNINDARGYFAHPYPRWPGFVLAAIAVVTAIIGTIVGIK
jgi:Mn2+/Fe2+ NRAMP family transporter